MANLTKDQRMYLTRVLIFARWAQGHAQDIHYDRERFDRSLLHQHAAIRCVIGGGEAVNKLRQTPEGVPKGIDLDDLVAMRHRLAHNHTTNVNLDLVWNVATKLFPELISRLESLLETKPPAD